MSTEIGKLHDWEEYYNRMYKKTGNEKYDIKRMKISNKIDEMTGMKERLNFREDVTKTIGEGLTRSSKPKVNPNAKYGAFLENGKIYTPIEKHGYISKGLIDRQKNEAKERIIKELEERIKALENDKR